MYLHNYYLIAFNSILLKIPKAQIVIFNKSKTQIFIQLLPIKKNKLYLYNILNNIHFHDTYQLIFSPGHTYSYNIGR